jgi:DNA-directed RNA polymerase specialized sigma24 family protein
LASFRRGVEAAVPALRRYARALTRDAELADDLVQDTLVRALRSEHLFHGGDLRSWLYTILTNLNRNRLRSLARRPPLSPIEDNDAAEEPAPRLAPATSNARWRHWSTTSAPRCCWWCWKACPTAKWRKCRACRSAP